MRAVVDWDGTATEIDGLHLVLVEFGDDEIYEAHEARLGRELTLHEVIAGEFTSVRAPLPEVVAWVRAHASCVSRNQCAGSWGERAFRCLSSRARQEPRSGLAHVSRRRLRFACEPYGHR